jgi:hypothetical protein
MPPAQQHDPFPTRTGGEPPQAPESARRAALGGRRSAGQQRPRPRRRRWLLVGGTVAVVLAVVLVALAVLRGPSSVLPGWLDRASGNSPSASAGPSSGGAGAGPGNIPDVAVVEQALDRAGTGTVTVRSFDGQVLARGSAAGGARGCSLDLLASGRRLVQAGARVYSATAAADGSQPRAWTDLTGVKAATVEVAALRSVGLAQAAPLVLAADPCRMLALARSAGVLAESPGPDHFVLSIPGTRLPGSDVVGTTVRRLLAAAPGNTVTMEVDLDAQQRPARIRAFASGVFDSEAQFADWGRGAAVATPPATAVSAPQG